MPRIVGIELYELDLPFRHAFRHAAAERARSESLFVRFVTDSGHCGYGETLPRPYVTGEERGATFDLLAERILPRVLGMSFASFQEVHDFLVRCDGKPPEAWVEREHGRRTRPRGAPSTSRCSTPSAAPSGRSSAAGCPGRSRRRCIGSLARGAPLRPRPLRASPVGDALATLLKARLYGIRDVKVKVDGQSPGRRPPRAPRPRPAGPASRRQQHGVELRRGARRDGAPGPLRRGELRAAAGGGRPGRDGAPDRRRPRGHRRRELPRRRLARAADRGARLHRRQRPHRQVRGARRLARALPAGPRGRADAADRLSGGRDLAAVGGPAGPGPHARAGRELPRRLLRRAAAARPIRCDRCCSLAGAAARPTSRRGAGFGTEVDMRAIQRHGGRRISLGAPCRRLSHRSCDDHRSEAVVRRDRAAHAGALRRPLRAPDGGAGEASAGAAARERRHRVRPPPRLRVHRVVQRLPEAGPDHGVRRHRALHRSLSPRPARAAHARAAGLLRDDQRHDRARQVHPGHRGQPARQVAADAPVAVGPASGTTRRSSTARCCSRPAPRSKSTRPTARPAGPRRATPTATCRRCCAGCTRCRTTSARSPTTTPATTPCCAWRSCTRSGSSARRTRARSCSWRASSARRPSGWCGTSATARSTRTMRAPAGDPAARSSAACARIRERAAFLERAAAAGGGRLLPRHVWPDMAALACWKGGTVRAVPRSARAVLSRGAAAARPRLAGQRVPGLGPALRRRRQRPARHRHQRLRVLPGRRRQASRSRPTCSPSTSSRRASATWSTSPPPAAFSATRCTTSWR